jgi:hypothetical protein
LECAAAHSFISFLEKLDDPETTAGSRLAAKARRLASKFTPEQRRQHFIGAMAMIYAGAKEATALTPGTAAPDRLASAAGKAY